MKLKLKLNGAAIKSLLLQHGEKAGFGIGVCVLVLFIWSAAKMDLLGPDKQPGKLEEAAKKTDEHILTSKWDPSAKGIEVVDYVQRAKRDPLNDKDYRIATPFTSPPFEQKGKRPDPKLLPVEEMLASAGLGIFALVKDEDLNAAGQPKPMGPKGGPMGPKGPLPGPGGKPPKGAAGAVAAPPPRAPKPQAGQNEMVKGVRASGNLKGYSWVVITGVIPADKQEAAFDDAFRNVIKPIPENDLPEYQGLKLERAEINGDAAPNWQPINPKDTKQFKAHWQVEAREVVDEQYINPMYTLPLAPLVGADWDPAVVGHPRVKLVEKPGALARSMAGEKPADDEEEDEGFGGRPNRVDNFGAPPPPQQRNRAMRNGVAPRRQVDLILFRFIDIKVEPGKQYRYRVQLKLSNPNYDVTERYLKNPESRKQKYVYTPWSEPTPVVTIPRDVEVFAGPVVKPAKEPQMKGLVTKLDREHGIMLVAEDTFQRGSLMNIRKKVEMDPIGGSGTPIEIDALLDSDSVIVDIEGGKPLKGPKSLTVPGEMVILQPDGSLVVRDELDDEPTYHTNLPPEIAPPAGTAAGLLSNDPYGKPKEASAPNAKAEAAKAAAEAKKAKLKKKKKPQ